MRRSIACTVILLCMSVLWAAPGKGRAMAKQAAQAIADEYFNAEARTMEPIANSIYAKPFAEIVASDQVESIHAVAQQLAGLVRAYPAGQLVQELQKFAHSHDYVLAVLVAAVVTYGLYRHVIRPAISG